MQQAIGYLGADVSKGMCDFIFLAQDGKQLEDHFQLDDNRAGHQQLVKLIKGWRKKYQLEKIVVGVESTGGYENNWYRGLRRISDSVAVEVFRINPKRIYHQAKKQAQQSITDGVSALTIAHFMIQEYGRVDLEARRANRSDGESSHKTLHRYIRRLIKQRTQNKNALEKVLYSLMPELLSIKKDGYANWFLELLQRFPSKRLMLAAEDEQLMDIKYITKARCQQIKQLLSSSVGSPAQAADELVIQELAQDIQHQTTKIKRVKKQLAQDLNESMQEDLKLMETIPGVAIGNAVGIRIEIGSLDRFEKAADLVAFFGIHPTVKQSGDKSYRMKMSKNGSPTARALFFQSAENVVLHDPYFKAIYHKRRKMGEPHRKAIGVIMSKLTRVIYGMLKNRTSYDPGIDQYNQQWRQEAPDKKQKNGTKQRRFQPSTNQAAPISARQRKKRKHEQSVSS